MNVAIHQPEYFPPLSFFGKLLQSNVFILLDTVDFDRTSCQHRAKIKGPTGPFWLTIPFKHQHPQQGAETEISYKWWWAKHQRALQSCYGRSPYYAAMMGQHGWQEVRRVQSVAVESVETVAKLLGYQGRIIRASEFGTSGLHRKSALVLNLCQAVGATTYLSGLTGSRYLEMPAFRAAKVEVSVQHFRSIEYPQRFGPFASGLSVVDALFNLGVDGTLGVIQSVWDRSINYRAIESSVDRDPSSVAGSEGESDA